MGWKTTFDSKVDPSGIKQEFTKINFNIHCCRYWKLSEWDYTNMSFPFWRFYYNTIEGASIKYKNKIVLLNKTKAVLIPPYTSFSTSLKQTKNERLSGNRIESREELYLIREMGMVDHLFIHFNLGFQYDHIKPQIYEFDVNEKLQGELNELRYSIIERNQQIEYKQSMKIYSIILQLVAQLDSTFWMGKNNDARVLKIVEYIDTNFANSLSNEYLADLAAMATNSFLRLFKEAMGTTIQQYLQQVRINKAILEMHNSEASIESIATQCGFSDRHHFSKVFKRKVGISPGKYRQQNIYH